MFRAMLVASAAVMSPAMLSSVSSSSPTMRFRLATSATNHTRGVGIHELQVQRAVLEVRQGHGSVSGIQLDGLQTGGLGAGQGQRGSIVIYGQGFHIAHLQFLDPAGKTLQHDLVVARARR